MGKKTKTGKGRLDKFYHLAKEQGYRSRAAFKLVQLNKKYHFLDDARVVIDLCAAPGGWLQVAAKNMPLSSLLIGIDLVPIAPIKGATTLVADITTPRCRKEIDKLVKTWKADVVLHDGAPNMGKEWSFDAFSQADLVLMSLKLATEFLRPGGTFVSKVFRSKDYNALTWLFKQFFTSVEATKPASSRGVSAEIFVVCRGYKAPDKIDPRLLDSKVVFAEVEAKPTVTDVFDTKIKRSRSGYADDAGPLLFKAVEASEYVSCAEPLALLAETNRITFNEPESKLLLRHPATSAELVLCCADLRVLGKGEFKSLVRWRERIREWQAKAGLTADDGPTAPTAEPGHTSVVTTEPIAMVEEDPEAKLEKEMAYFREKARLREKRAKKARREELRAYRRKLALNMITPDVAVETPTEIGLFELRQVRGGEQALETLLADKRAPQLIDAALAGGFVSDDDDDEVAPRRDVYERFAAEEEDLRLMGEAVAAIDENDWDAVTEAALEYDYNRMQATRRARARRIVPSIGKREKLREADELDMSALAPLPAHAASAANGDGDDDGNGDEDVVVRPNLDVPVEALAGVAFDEASESEASGRSGSDGSDGDACGRRRARGAASGASAAASSSSQRTPLLVDFDPVQSKEAVAAARTERWFAQDVFSGLLAEDDGDALALASSRKRSAPEPEAADATAEPARKKRKIGMADGIAEAVVTAAGDAPVSSAAAQRAAALANAQRLSGERKHGRSGVDIVALEEPSSSEHEDSESDSRSCRDAGSDDEGAGGAGDAGSDGSFEVAPQEDEFDDSDDRAEFLAMAQEYAKNRRINRLADAAYNRWAVSDRETAPRWFAEEEVAYMTPVLPITREQAAELKAQQRDINARPIRKVLEARARKRKRALAKQEALKRRLNALNSEDDVSERAKSRAMERAIKKGASAAARGAKERVYVVAKKGGRSAVARGTKKTGRIYKMVDRVMKKEVRAAKSRSKRAKR